MNGRQILCRVCSFAAHRFNLIRCAAKLHTLLCLIITSIAFAGNPPSLQKQVNALINQYTPEAYVGIAVKDANSDNFIYEQNIDKAFSPASNLKLFTATTALHYLGPHYRYSTTLGIYPNKIKHHTLQGNVYLKFQGDPSFNVKNLNQFIKNLSTKRIQHIRGNIVLDNSYFEKPDYLPGMSNEDRNWYYSAPASAIIINQNYVTLHLIPANTLNHLATVKPERGMQYVTIKHHVNTVTYDQAEHHCSLLLHVDQNNHISMGGCWPIRGAFEELNIAIKNPSRFAAMIIRSLLKKNRIQFSGKIIVGKMPKNITIIATHHSKPLADLIRTMLKDSNNLYANSITKLLGKKYYGHGTIQEGANAIKKILAPITRINFKQAKIFDGAGSRYNLVTPYQFIQLLYTVYFDKTLYPIIKSALPESGKNSDGTFSKLATLRKLPRDINAKTGSMKGVSALSGYLTTKHGKTLLFSILINNSPKKLKNARKLQTKLCRLFREV